MAKRATKINAINKISFSKDRQRFVIGFQREGGGTFELECPVAALDDLILKLHDVEEKAFLHDPTAGPLEGEVERIRSEPVSEVRTTYGNINDQPTFFLGLVISAGFTRWFDLPADQVEDFAKVVVDSLKASIERDSH